MQQDSHILAEKRGALALLTLNRPQALNALTPGMVAAISGENRAVAAEVWIPAFSNSRPRRWPPIPPPTPVSRVQGRMSNWPGSPE